MREPTGIAVAGDWHGNTEWAVERILQCGESGINTLVHTGDFGYHFERGFVEGLERACTLADVLILFIDGNHDNHDLLWSLPLDKDGFGVLTPHIRYIPRGHRWEMKGQTWMGVGGAVSVDKKSRTPGISWWPTERISAGTVYKATLDGEVDVLVTHDVPAGVPIPGVNENPYARSNAGWPSDVLIEAAEHRKVLYGIFSIVRPRLLFHGHYHRFYDTLFEGCRVVGLDRDKANPTDNVIQVLTKEELTEAETAQ